MPIHLLRLFLPLLAPAPDGGGGGGSAGAPATDDPPADDEPATDDPATDDDPDDDDGGVGGGDNDLDADALRAELSKVRREAAKYRTERNNERTRIATLEEQNKAILKALGVSDDDDEDPAAEVEKLRTENRHLKTRQAFDAAAREAGADEDLTWGYLLARGEIDGLDPDSDDFAKTLKSAIKTALEAKPTLAVKPAPPPAGGADLDSDDNPKGKKPEEMSMEEFMEWRAERDKPKE